MIGFKIVVRHKKGFRSLKSPNVQTFLVKLEIPDDEWVLPAGNTAFDHENGFRKCRAAKAKVLSITPLELHFDEYGFVSKMKHLKKQARSEVMNRPDQDAGPKTLYRVGRWVKADKWNESIKRSGMACDHGIHFFLCELNILPYLNYYFV